MKLTFSCPNCGKLYRASTKNAGREGLCKKCGATIVLPSIKSDDQSNLFDRTKGNNLNLEASNIPISTSDASKTSDSPIPVAKTYSPPQRRNEYRQGREAFEKQSNPTEIEWNTILDETINRRKRNKPLHSIWRALTLGLIFFAGLGYFLPWVKVYFTPIPSAIVPMPAAIRPGLEIFSQSGLQLTFGFSKLNPAFVPIAKQNEERQEQLWRTQGKDLQRERLSNRASVSAIWLLTYPLFLFLACIFSLAVRPSAETCGIIGGLCLLSGAVAVVQIGMLNPPMLVKLHEDMHVNQQPISSLAGAMLFDTNTGAGFLLSIVAIVFAIGVQLLYLCIEMFYDVRNHAISPS